MILQDQNCDINSNECGFHRLDENDVHPMLNETTVLNNLEMVLE